MSFVVVVVVFCFVGVVVMVDVVVIFWFRLLNAFVSLRDYAFLIYTEQKCAGLLQKNDYICSEPLV